MKLDLKTRLEGRVEQLAIKFRPSPCVFVYYDGEMAALAALRAACVDLNAGTRIVAVYSDMVPLIPEPKERRQTRAFNAQAVLAAATVNAAVYGFHIETIYLEAHTRGQALAQLAADCGDSTIYLGVDPAHPDWLADYLQKHAPANLVLVQV